jgi:hypothetical protein
MDAAAAGHNHAGKDLWPRVRGQAVRRAAERLRQQRAGQQGRCRSREDESGSYPDRGGRPGQLYRAAQVSGPTAALAKVEAVAQLEADFNTVFRIKALVPINNTNPIADGIHRVPGVGVTAVIDSRI